jgi:23S rRNA (cytidine1920-2'-O)/16S rRNA (cytidine1409-2'-O)-methyltransferase
MVKDTGNTERRGPGERLRLDRLLVDRGLAESREQAQRLIMAGRISIVGQVKIKSGMRVPSDAQVSLSQPERYVSRGALKLEAALHEFQLDVTGRICADVGASTGGFTDCLLQAGAARVYAIDVGRGQLHERLRHDTRVFPVPYTNARDIRADTLPEQVELVCVDLSFISLRLVLPVLPLIATPDCECVVLVKPQFEATPSEVSRGKGVVTDRKVHLRVLNDMLAFVPTSGMQVRGLIPSPVLGRSGNREYLLHLTQVGPGQVARLPIIDIDGVVSQALTMERCRSTSH